MIQKVISEIVKLVRKAQELALSIGIPNILQPGLVKEMIISEILPLKVKVIYEIQPILLLKEAEGQLDRSRNRISHVGFSESWAKQNGKIVFQNKEA